MSTNLFDEQVGLLKKGTIISYNKENNTVKVRLASVSSVRGNNPLPIDVPAPNSMFFNNGSFIGSQPFINTPVIVSQGSGGQYYIVSTIPENLPALPTTKAGELLIQSNDDTKISLDIVNNISIGSDNNKIHIDTSENLITNNFYNQNHFSQASRKVSGIVKRDLSPNINVSSDSKLEVDSYNKNLFTIALDPKTTPNAVISGTNKNPAFIESREITYEFQYSADIEDDYNESLLYKNSLKDKNFVYPNRRKSRSDTLSLTLASPNYLMETVKGTVIDIFGNILDLNRNPIPIGQDASNSLRSEKSNDKSQSFLKIKEMERKSLAFHFEMNARKDLTGSDGKVVLPDVNSNSDYSRNRSRLFLDIDKEGQFKLNIPASSETGNVSLLTRYENYSTVGPEDNNNPNKLIFREDNLDILQDSFAAPVFDINTGSYSKDKGVISVMDKDSNAAPIDRITGYHLKAGTAFHDISATCYTHQKVDFLNWQAETFVDIASIPLLSNVVSKTINVSGDNANAGGRSGSISLDGMIDFSIGANTIDRQSLLLDTAGGMVANFGRDKNGNSAVMSMDGNCFWQIGSMAVSTDSRFEKQNNGLIGGVLDIRVLNAGLRCTMIRIDNEGVKIMSPGNIQVHAGTGMTLSTDGNLQLTGENVFIQDRLVQKNFGGSI